VRGADLEAGEAIEGAFEDEVRQRDRRLERIADGIGEQAIAPEPARPLQLGRAQRVDEHEDAELLGLGPKRMKLGVAQLEAVDAAAEAGARRPYFLTPCSSCSAARSGCAAPPSRATNRPAGAAQICEGLVLELKLARDRSADQ
jgi:hypothetical protein